MSYVAKITIDHTKVPADLTDFPVYVNLADLPSAFWSLVADGGGDIRCFKDDGTTELAREVVSCVQASDTGEMYVKYTGTLSSTVDTVIRIYADGVSSEPAVGATYGRNAVWSDYRLVSHGGTLDSSGNVTVTKAGNFIETTSNTKIGLKAYATDTGNTGSQMTIGSVSGRTVSLFARKTETNGTNSGYLFDARTGLSNGYFYTDNASGTLAYGGGWTNVYKDGALATPNVTTFTINTYAHYLARSSATWTATIVFGNRYSNTGAQDVFGGQLDEIRLTKTLDRDANWAAAEANNLLSASTFYAASPAAVNVNPTATTLSCTFSIPTYTVAAQQNRTVSPTTLSCTFSIPAYAVSAGASKTVSTLSATFSIPTYQVIAGNVAVAPTTLSLTFSIPSYTVSTGATVFPSTLSCTFSIPSHGVDIGANIAAQTLSMSFSIPTYSVSVTANPTVTPATLSMTFTIPAYSVALGIDMNPSTLGLTLSIPAYTVTVTANIVVLATPLSLAFSLPALKLVGGVWRRTPQASDEWSKTPIGE